MLKYLRIAVTALSLTACVLLIALWVRSYSWADSIINTPNVTSAQGNLFISENGEFTVEAADRRSNSRATFRLGVLSVPIDGATVRATNPAVTVTVPHWILVLATAGCGAAPWLTLRFSLRTLLIATTLVAVGLGAVIYLAR